MISFLNLAFFVQFTNFFYMKETILAKIQKTNFYTYQKGNFLFAYAHHSVGGLYAGKEFDLDFHLSAVTEMARVTKSELRLSPMGSFSPPSRPHDYRDAVMKCLQELGFTCTLERSYFDSGLKGFNDVLIAKRKS
jgi:hypothetical protein